MSDEAPKKPHDWYYSPTGYAIDEFMDRYRCTKCSTSTTMWSWVRDTECPEDGAPDWKAIDAEEHSKGFERMLEKIRRKKNEPAH